VTLTAPDERLVYTSAVTWHGTSTATAADIIDADKGRPGPEPTERNEAAADIVALLIDGPVPTKTIEAQLEARGHSRSTYLRAKAELKIMSRQLGDTRFYWMTEAQWDALRAAEGRQGSEVAITAGLVDAAA
jgi:hypothetical protein